MAIATGEGEEYMIFQRMEALAAEVDFPVVGRLLFRYRDNLI